MAWNRISGASLMGPSGPPGSDADVTDHEAAADPHPQYSMVAEQGDFPSPVGSSNTVGSSEFAARADHIHRLDDADRTLLDSVTGKADADHTHDVSDITGLQTELDGKFDAPSGTGTAGQVLTPGGWANPDSRSDTSAATIDADAQDLVDLALNEDTTLSEPTGGYFGKVIQVFAEARDAEHTLSFDSAYLRLGGIESSYSIPSGRLLRAGLRMSNSGWIVEAVGVTQ